MKLKEEKELKEIVDEYGKAMHQFQRKNLAKAQDLFSDVIKKYDNSEFFSVLEIQTRAKVYQSLIQSILNPVRISLKTREDYLWEGTYQLNAGNFDRAIDLLDNLQKKFGGDAQLYYLLALAHFQKEDVDTALQFMKRCVKEEDVYKVLLYNEPDLELLHQNKEFLAIVE